MRKKILIVAAHPDDEILGCGATVARLIREGAQASTLILGTGVTSRLPADKRGAKGKIKKLQERARKANKLTGIKQVYFHDFPDNKFDTVPFLDIVKVIEGLKSRLKPEIIFTHSCGDLNIDHRIAYRAVLTAARPLRGEAVKELYSFEVASSTEWNYPFGFVPDLFFNIEKTLEIKLRSLKEYQEEIKSFPHPRSLEGAKINARYRGMSVGLKYAEAFKAVRRIV